MLRWPSQRRVREQVSPERIEEFKQAATRYVLVIAGSAPLDWMHRCTAGGYDFAYINVELVDVRTNETVLSTSGAGYSEGCAPLQGRSSVTSSRRSRARGDSVCQAGCDGSFNPIYPGPLGNPPYNPNPWFGPGNETSYHQKTNRAKRHRARLPPLKTLQDERKEFSRSSSVRS